MGIFSHGFSCCGAANWECSNEAEEAIAKSDAARTMRGIDPNQPIRQQVVSAAKAGLFAGRDAGA
jgi:hypothetical protein